MITTAVLDRFLNDVKGQALREGTRYAQEARVGEFVGTTSSATTVVRGHATDFEVALWVEAGVLAHRCSCPSWRNPCKHEVAAAQILRQAVSGAAESGGRAADARPRGQSREADEARERALEERRAGARREKLTVSIDRPPLLRVASASGFAYRVHLRGDADGPHSCDCPDFEANRLHTCKHVERVRRFLRATRARLPKAHRSASRRPRVYLHFGERIEPRLLGRPEGKGAPAVRAAFDVQGAALRPLARDDRELRDWLTGMGVWAEPDALAWLDRRIEREPVFPRGEFAALLPPLRLQPYPYQWTGAAFLATTGRALLADEMGLGKTVQAILAAVAMRRAKSPVDHVTIVCPASLRGGWQDEIRRWIGEDAVLLEGPATERARVIAARPPWLVSHYEQVLRDQRHHAAAPPDLLIIDEAQRAKGLQTRTARALKAIGARHVFALTGTPLENRLEEAYAIAQLIDQRLLPPLWQIDRDHFVRDDDGRRVVLYRNLDALRAHLAPAFLRRRKEDVALQLPDRVRSVGMVAMHPAVVDTYEDVMTQVRRIAKKKVILPADLERMQRLLVIARRCCNGPHMLGVAAEDRDVPKLRELEESLRELCLGERRKAVVFSEWTDMTDRVEALCERLHLPAFHLCGDVPVRRRPELIRAFTESAAPAVFISTDAGGVGLNLQAADVVVNLDLPWNPARLEQRVARVHRIGSTRTVQELLLVTQGSIEEYILHLHKTKRNVLENVWAKKGEDVIGAPGGSGAFREMVLAMLETQAPADATKAGQTAELDGTEPELADEIQRPTLASWRAEAGIGADAGASLEGGKGPRTVHVGERATASPVAHPASVGSPTLGVDPAALAAAVAAVAPTLPSEHRRSLAVVFRALAGALEA